MERFISATAAYIRMGYLLHLVTIVDIVIIAIAYSSWHDNWNILKVCFFGIMMACPVFPQLDARSRFQNYKLVRDHLLQFGYKDRILKPFTKSRCQRDAVMMACRQLGHAKACAAYFTRRGYRWYHLFPDVIVKNPLIFFNPNFIKTTFFEKTYHSRFGLCDRDSAQQDVANRQKLFTFRNVIKGSVSDFNV